jgi:hypothetical protein
MLAECRKEYILYTMNEQALIPTNSQRRHLDAPESE